MPPLRLNPNDDYLTARAANPRTGLITPFTPAGTSPNHSPSPFDYITIRSPPNSSIYNNRKNVSLPRSPDLEFDLGPRRANGRQHQRGLSGPKWLDRIRKQSGSGSGIKAGEQCSDALCGKGVRMGQAGGIASRSGRNDMDMREPRNDSRHARGRSASTELQGQQLGNGVELPYPREITAPYPVTDGNPDDLSFFNVPRRTRPPVELSGASLNVSQLPRQHTERIRFDTTVQHPTTRRIPLQHTTHCSPPKNNPNIVASTSFNSLIPPSSPKADHHPSKRRSFSLPVLTTTLHFDPPATREDRSPTTATAPRSPDSAETQTRLPRIRRKPVVSPSEAVRNEKPVVGIIDSAPHVSPTRCLQSGEKVRSNVRPQPRPVQRRVRVDDSSSILGTALPGDCEAVDAAAATAPDDDNDNNDGNSNDSNDQAPSREGTTPPKKKRDYPTSTSTSPLHHLPSIRLVPPHLAALPRHRHKAAAPAIIATHVQNDPSLTPPGVGAPLPPPPPPPAALTIKSLPALLAGLLCLSHVPSIWNATTPAQSRLQGLRELLTFLSRSLAVVLVGCCAFRVLGVVWSVLRVVLWVVRFVVWVGRGVMA